MKQTIQALETEYAGRRFRSRLEARWACALDALDIAWEYEDNGFSLPSGRYLPDFLLRDMGGVANEKGLLWLEVKPDDESVATDSRWEDLAILSRIPVVVVFGMPRPDLGESAVVYGSVREKGHMEVFPSEGGQDFGYALTLCEKCKKPGITFEGVRGRVCNHADEIHGAADARVLAAYKKALGARFEQPGVRR